MMNERYRYNWSTGSWELTGRILTIRGIDPSALFSGEQIVEMVESLEAFKARGPQVRFKPKSWFKRIAAYFSIN